MTTALLLPLLLATAAPATRNTPATQHTPATQDAPSGQDAPEVQVRTVFDVQDLAVEPFTGATDARTLDPLLEMARRKLGFQAGDERLQVEGGSLKTLLTNGERMKLSRFLGFQRLQLRHMVRLESKLYTGDAIEGAPDDAMHTSIYGPGTEPEDLPFTGQVWSLSSPKMVILPGNTSELRVSNEVAYVSRYDVVEHVQPGDQRLEVPVIEKDWDGLRLRGRALWYAEDQVEVRIEVEDRHVEGFDDATDDATGKPLHIPRMRSRTVSFHAIVPLGGAAAVWGAPEEGRALGAIVRVLPLDGPKDASGEGAPDGGR